MDRVLVSRAESFAPIPWDPKAFEALEAYVDRVLVSSTQPVGRVICPYSWDSGFSTHESFAPTPGIRASEALEALEAYVEEVACLKTQPVGLNLEPPFIIYTPFITKTAPI